MESLGIWSIIGIIFGFIWYVLTLTCAIEGIIYFSRKNADAKAKARREEYHPPEPHKVENPSGKWNYPKCNAENSNSSYKCTGCGYKLN